MRGAFVSLGVLQALIGIGAVAGGLGLALNPGGEGLQMPIELLEKTPFEDFLIPGVVLLVVNGLGSLTGAGASFRRHRCAGPMAMALGAFLVAWILAQVYWFDGFHWLHWLYLGLGIVELALGWSVKRDAAGPANN